jgi:uncharacterized membrane protein YhaH (DUF805 family)
MLRVQHFVDDTGCLDRPGWWQGMAMLVAADFLLQSGLAALWPKSAIGLGLSHGATMLLLWPAWCLDAARLRDRGRAPALALLVLAPVALWSLAGAAGLQAPLTGIMAAWLPLALLWCIFELGCGPSRPISPPARRLADRIAALTGRSLSPITRA